MYQGQKYSIDKKPKWQEDPSDKKDPNEKKSDKKSE